MDKPLGRGCAVRYIVTSIQAAASYQLIKLLLFTYLKRPLLPIYEPGREAIYRVPICCILRTGQV